MTLREHISIFGLLGGEEFGYATAVSGLGVFHSPIPVSNTTKVSLIADGFKLFHLSLEVLAGWIKLLCFAKLCPSLTKMSVEQANLRRHNKNFCVYLGIMVPRDSKREFFLVVSIIIGVKRAIDTL